METRKAEVRGRKSEVGNVAGELPFAKKMIGRQGDK